MTFPILGFERFLELHTTSVNTFQDFYYNEEEKNLIETLWEKHFVL